MKILEIIHLRMADDHSGVLVDLIRAAKGSPESGMQVTVYQHSAFATDLAIHLSRETRNERTDGSELGKRLDSLLRSYGMVEHSTWVELPE